MQRLGGWLLIVAVSTAPACDGDDSSDTGASTTTAAMTTTSAGSTSGSGGTTGVLPGTTTAPADPLPFPSLRQCTKICEGPWDCCPFGQEGCPGIHPWDFVCQDSVCVRPACADDDACVAGRGPGWECHPVAGIPTCIEVCSADADCATAESGSACAGMAEDGAGYCQDRCDAGPNPCGVSTCDPVSGRCLCEADGNCPGDQVCPPAG